MKNILPGEVPFAVGDEVIEIGAWGGPSHEAKVVKVTTRTVTTRAPTRPDAEWDPLGRLRRRRGDRSMMLGPYIVHATPALRETLKRRIFMDSIAVTDRHEWERLSTTDLAAVAALARKARDCGGKS